MGASACGWHHNSEVFSSQAQRTLLFCSQLAEIYIYYLSPFLSFENVPDSIVTRFQIENFWDSAWINSCSNSNALRKQMQSLPKSLLGKSNYVDHSRTFEVDPNGPQLSSQKTGCIQSTVTWNINIQGVWLLQLRELERRSALNPASLAVWVLSRLEAAGTQLSVLISKMWKVAICA